MNWPEKPRKRKLYFAPPSVTVSLVGTCNGLCSYCQIRNRPFAPMPPDKADFLFRALSRHGTLRVGFTQDEPLLHPQLGRILRNAAGKFRFITLGSNGFLVPEKINELLEGRLNALILPLDGPADIQDRHRGEGAFAAVEKAAEIAGTKGIPLWFTCVLAADNLNSINETLRLAQEMGGKLHVQPLYHDPNIAGDTAAFVPDRDNLRHVIESLISHKKEGRPLLNSIASLQLLLRWPDFACTRLASDDAKAIRLPRCRGARLFAHISSQGQLYPCTEEVGCGPSIFELGLPEALRQLRHSGDVCRYSCLGSDYLEYNLLAAPNLMAWKNLFEILLAELAGK